MRARSSRLTPALAGAVLVAAVGLLSPQPAAAYCRTSVCAGEPAALCTPTQPDDCGIPLLWSPPCLGYSVQQDASVQVTLEVANDIMDQAFGAWMAVTCPAGGQPNVRAVNLGPVECDQREYNQSGGNANLIVFRDDEWPYIGQGSTLALTTVTYHLDTGQIYDADLEINSAAIHITTGDVEVEYDLLSITTHEVGHVLGLAHSPEQGATMDIDYESGDTSLRSLEADDIAAICAAYPPSEVSLDSCDPTPRHGFKSTCGPGPEEEDGGCCSVAGATSGSAGGFWLLAAMAAASLVRSRGRGRRSAAGA